MKVRKLLKVTLWISATFGILLLIIISALFLEIRPRVPKLAVDSISNIEIPEVLFTSDSLAYIQNQDLYIHMLNELLFEEAEGKIFSELGTSLLRESCSAVIRHMGKKVYVNVRVRKQAVGESQGNGIKLFILQRLQLPGEDIEVTVEIVPATIAEQVTLVVRH